MKSTFGTVCLALAVAIAVVLCWHVTTAQEFSLFAEEQAAQQAAPETPVAAPTRERIMQLPNDGNAWHLSVCLSDSWRDNRREKEIRDWFFDANLQLTSLRVQTQFHEYTPRHSMFRSLLAHRIPTTPAVVLQDQTGYVVYASCESSKYRSIPTDPNDLADDMAEAIAARCQQMGLTASECDRCKPRPRPTPQPSPNINVDVNLQKPIVPRIDKKDEFPWGLLGAVCAVVILASVAYNFRKEMAGQ